MLTSNITVRPGYVLKTKQIYQNNNKNPILFSRHMCSWASVSLLGSTHNSVMTWKKFDFAHVFWSSNMKQDPRKVRHDQILSIYPALYVSVVLNSAVSHRALRLLDSLAQSSAGGTWHHWDENHIFCLGCLHSYSYTQLPPFFSASLTPHCGALLLGMWSWTSLYYQTAVDVDTWYISKWVGLSASLKSVNFFKAYLTFVKPVILISTYIDHRTLQKVTYTSMIKVLIQG